MSGLPKVPLVVKVKKATQEQNTVSFSGDGYSDSLAGPKEGISYFDGWEYFAITFQPIAPFDDDETK
jgi:hypothetical protein